MKYEALDALRDQVNTTYSIVTRTYDSSGNMTGESRAEHPEPYIKLTHDQGVELLALINKTMTDSKEPVMVRSEFNNMCNMMFHYCGACGDGLPISAKRAKFCPWCGRSVKWE